MKDQENKTGLALTGAVVAAVTASLCCILPLLAALLGVAGFAASEVFAHWRPYLLVVSFVLLALGFYLAYRPERGEACKGDSLCACKPLGRWNRAMLWLATVFVLVFAAFPNYRGWVVRAVSRRTQSAGTVVKTGGAHVVLKIDGMDCPVCAGGLQNSLRGIPGVERAEVSFQEKRATIDYDPRAVDSARFVKVIRDAGFKVAGLPQTMN